MNISTRQEQQGERRKQWVDTEGGVELPIQLATYLQPLQQARITWLAQNVTGSILELGCSWGYVLAICRGQAGVDNNPDTLAIARALAREREFHCMDALKVLDYFGPQAFDTVMVPEILEHLPKSDAQSLVWQALIIARKRVLVTIPDGAEDTEEATCFKHHWLIDEEALRELLPASAIIKVITPFLCARVDK